MTSLSNRECDVKCPGDQSQLCGGKGSISLFNFKYNGKGINKDRDLFSKERINMFCFSYQHHKRRLFYCYYWTSCRPSG